MYSDLSKAWKYLNRGVTSLAWITTGAIGASATFVPPGTVVSQQGLWVSLTWCVLTVVGAGAGLLGELRGHYWTQLIGSLVATVGISAYTLTVWAIVADGSPTRSAQAFALTALIFFALRQAVLCGSQAYRVRQLHRNLPEV